MKKILPVLFILSLAVSCNKPTGELVGIGNKGTFHEANPYGMVFIKRGAFMMGPNDQSVLNSDDRSLNVTVDAFWMDETEITNDEYKQFVYWVRDSIIRRNLAIAGHDEFIKRNRNDQDEPSPETGVLNWRTRIPWNSRDEEVQDVIASMSYQGENNLGKKQIDPAKLKFKYYWLNYDQAALPRNKYNVNTGAYLKGASARVDSSYVDENGVIHNVTITRPLKTRRDLISNKIVNIYPDTIMWIRDFQFAYNDPKMKMYFSHKGFAQYPVVGVTWEQAQAFCQWRTGFFNNSHTIEGQEYRLPTEAEWEYASRGGKALALYPWGGNYVRDAKGCYLANFKPMRGSYTDDTGATTMKVGSFAPNNYGLYDMAGNAAEWTSTAYGANATLVNDMNPNYQYNAKNEDPNILKRKVIKGGSWKDIAYYLQCGVKTFEYQYEARPYVGFRCVRSYNGE
ncbi:MAG: SUMF1/EgtB/PvdO family nonheme iron enzyme [Paludibacteraceae bacterium]